MTWIIVINVILLELHLKVVLCILLGKEVGRTHFIEEQNHISYKRNGIDKVLYLRFCVKKEEMLQQFISNYYHSATKIWYQ